MERRTLLQAAALTPSLALLGVGEAQAQSVVEVSQQGVTGPLTLAHLDDAMPPGTTDIVMSSWEYSDILEYRDRLDMYGDRDIVKGGLGCLYGRDSIRIWFRSRDIPWGLVLFMKGPPVHDETQVLDYLTVNRDDVVTQKVYLTPNGFVYERGFTRRERATSVYTRLPTATEAQVRNMVPPTRYGFKPGSELLTLQEAQENDRYLGPPESYWGNPQAYA